MKKDNLNIRKPEEFSAFIQTLKTGTISHWVDIAKAIGVNKDTITEWKKLPEAQQAITEGIARGLTEMEYAGKKDWRMWESKLKMLGVVPIDKTDITSDGDKLEIQQITYQEIIKKNE